MEMHGTIFFFLLPQIQSTSYINKLPLIYSVFTFLVKIIIYIYTHTTVKFMIIDHK